MSADSRRFQSRDVHQTCALRGANWEKNAPAWMKGSTRTVVVLVGCNACDHFVVDGFLVYHFDGPKAGQLAGDQDTQEAYIAAYANSGRYFVNLGKPWKEYVPVTGTMGWTEVEA